MSEVPRGSTSTKVFAMGDCMAATRGQKLASRACSLWRVAIPTLPLEVDQKCVLPSLPNGKDLILGNDFLSKFDILIRPARAECSWFSKAQNKHLCIHGCSTIMPIQNAPRRDINHPDGRANLLRHHILTLGTHNDTKSNIWFLN